MNTTGVHEDVNMNSWVARIYVNKRFKSKSPFTPKKMSLNNVWNGKLNSIMCTTWHLVKSHKAFSLEAASPGAGRPRHLLTEKVELKMSGSSPINKKAKTAENTRPMTLPEKILAEHAVGLKSPFVTPGEMICVKVQWTLACEITWKSMDKTYQDMGRPRIWRNDRFWLAVDHTVDPRVNEQPRQQMMIKVCRHVVYTSPKSFGMTSRIGIGRLCKRSEFNRISGCKSNHFAHWILSTTSTARPDNRWCG